MNKIEKMHFEKMHEELAALKASAAAAEARAAAAEARAAELTKKPAAEPDFKISFINYLIDLAEKKDSGQLAIIAGIVNSKGSPADLFNYSAYALNIIKLISAENFKILRETYKNAVSQAEAWPAFIALKPKKSKKNISAKNEPAHAAAANAE